MYRAFRAPTLNELYRSFRLANVLTQNNPFLNAERLTGAEAGVNITTLQSRLDLRGTFFWSDIVDPVQNVTINPTSNPVLRQKQNLGRIRSRGVELDGVAHVTRDIQLAAGYEFTDATVVNYTVPPGEISLLGKNVAQVPRHVFTWEARYWNPSRILLSVQGRFVGNQFDDDQNQRSLAGYGAVDASVEEPVTPAWDAFVRGRNLTGYRAEVGKSATCVVTVGEPLVLAIGVEGVL